MIMNPLAKAGTVQVIAAPVGDQKVSTTELMGGTDMDCPPRFGQVPSGVVVTTMFANVLTSLALVSRPQAAAYKFTLSKVCATVSRFRIANVMLTTLAA